jgi:hypothetical protein
VDCDGAFAIYDGIEYGLRSDALQRASINPHHPLFHALALPLVIALRAIDVGGAGHVAVRILSGLGGAWLLLQICAAAAPRRLAGAAFAAPLLASRGFLVEAAAGETILPGAAAALFALRTASRPGVSLPSAAAALTFAVLLRQDNVLLAPGVAAAICLTRPAGERTGSAVRVVAGAGLATLLGYGIAWGASTGGEIAFRAWIVGHAELGPWGRAEDLQWIHFSRYLTSILDAMTGAFTLPGVMHPWLGLAHLAPFLAAGWLLRGTAPRLTMLVPAALTLAGWAALHTWFQASNFEYLIPPVALVAGSMAGLAAGKAASPPLARRAGAVLLLAFAAWVLLAHGPYTWRLRERRFADAIAEARGFDDGRTRFVAVGHRAHLGFDLLGIDHGTVAVDRTIDDIFGQIDDERRRHSGRVVLVIERFAGDGMPWAYRDSSLVEIDTAADPPQATLLRREGRVYGVVYDPPAAGSATRPDSR